MPSIDPRCSWPATGAASSIQNMKSLMRRIRFTSAIGVTYARFGRRSTAVASSDCLMSGSGGVIDFDDVIENNVSAPWVTQIPRHRDVYWAEHENWQAVL